MYLRQVRGYKNCSPHSHPLHPEVVGAINHKSIMGQNELKEPTTMGRGPVPFGSSPVYTGYIGDDLLWRGHAREPILGRPIVATRLDYTPKGASSAAILSSGLPILEALGSYWCPGYALGKALPFCFIVWSWTLGVPLPAFVCLVIFT